MHVEVISDAILYSFIHLSLIAGRILAPTPLRDMIVCPEISSGFHSLHILLKMTFRANAKICLALVSEASIRSMDGASRLASVVFNKVIIVTMSSVSAGTAVASGKSITTNTL